MQCLAQTLQAIMSFGTTSSLAVLLLKAFAKGELPATRVAEIAKAAFDDGWGRNDRLARDLAAAADQSRQNILRAVVAAARRAGLMRQFSQPYMCKVPGPGGALKDMIIFLPHEIYFKLIESTHGQKDSWCLTEEVLAKEEGLGKTLRTWCDHPDVACGDNPSEIGVFGIHADGASYTSSNRAGSVRSVLVGSCNIISAKDPHVRSKRHFLYTRSKGALCDCGCAGYHTYQAINDVLGWSFECLAKGRFPTCRHDGSAWTPHDRKNRILLTCPLPKAALLQLRGDWEWITQCFRFRTASQNEFCWMCQACQAPGPNCYLAMSANADYRRTLITHQAYFELCAMLGFEPSAIFRAPGFVLEYATVDSMHSGDSGAFADATGTVFWLHISDKNRYRNSALGLASLNKQLHNFYLANKHRKLTRIDPLTYSQIRAKKPGYPYLKTSAAGSRHVTEFALALAYAHRDGTSSCGPRDFPPGHRLHGRALEHNNLVVQMMEGLVSYQRSAAEEPFNSSECKSNMYKFLTNFVSLHNMWREGVPEDAQAALPFHARPKLHLLQHLVEEKIQLFGSPNSFHCYMDEDYVGVIKKVCAASKHPATLERRVSEKCQIMAGILAFEQRAAAVGV